MATEAAPRRIGQAFDTDELVLNMGPQHPSTHGVLRVVLRLDGERVVDADGQLIRICEIVDRIHPSWR